MFSPNIKREYFSQTNEAQGLDPKLVDQAYAELHTEIDRISGENIIDADKKVFKISKFKKKVYKIFIEDLDDFLMKKNIQIVQLHLKHFKKKF